MIEVGITFIVALLKFLAPLFLANKLGEANERADNAEVSIAALKAEAKRQANTPVTPFDAAAILRARAKSKRRDR